MDELIARIEALEARLDKMDARSKRFKPPSLAELSDYMAEKGYTFDPLIFMAHYESNGWMVGKTKMKSWQAACFTWNKGKSNGQFNGSGKSSYQQRVEEADLRTFNIDGEL